MKYPSQSRPLLSLVLLAGLSASVAAKDLSLIRGPLESTGVDTNASGVIQSKFTPNNPQLRARLGGLTPGASYQFTVDGVNQGDFVAPSNGRPELSFRLHPKGLQLALDFDPRGHLLAVNDGTADVLKMVFSGVGEPTTILVDERTTLKRADGVLRGAVEARYLAQKNQDRFIVFLKSLDLGTYKLYVGGQLKGEVTLTKGRSTQFVFKASGQAQAKKSPASNGHGAPPVNNKRLTLNFDPRGEIIDLVKDGVVVFSGEMLAKVAGINAATPAKAETMLVSTGADADATATAEVSVNGNNEKELSIEVQNLPVGEYVVAIGSVEYPLTVSDVAGVTKGALGFSTDPDGGELLLDFDPAGQAVEIRQGTTVFFTGTINGTLTPDPVATGESFELPLLNQGIVSTASGEVSFATAGVGDSQFAVSVANLPAGDYQLAVGGVAKATITVSNNGGALEGSVSFSTLPTVGEVLLDFDPRGQLVEVTQNGSAILSRTLPN